MSLAKVPFPADRGCGCDRTSHHGGLSMKSPYPSSNTVLAAGASLFQSDAIGRAGARDFTQPVYTPWRMASYTPGSDYTMAPPAELLQALRFVKGSPLTVTPGPSAAMPTVLSVSVQQDATWAGTVASTIYTDVAPAIVDGPTTLESALILNLARIGLRVTALKIDSAVAPSVSRDPSAWRVAATSNRLLMTLDTLMGTATTGGFQSLGELAALVEHLDAAPGSTTLDDLAISLITSVSASGRGCGEGAHCLIGNNEVLTALAMTATAKANGSCGWRHDPRTGLTVYHFLGVPFYRCDIAGGEGTQSLFSANLGATGLTMVHGYGTAETYGLEVDQEPVNPGIASRDMIVHGAYALAMWDPGSLFGYNAITL